MIHVFFRQLSRGIKNTNRFNYVIIELHAKRKFISKREHIYDATSYRKLSGFQNKITALEFIFVQKFDDKIYR